MATRRSSNAKRVSAAVLPPNGDSPANPGSPAGPQFTGKFIALLKERSGPKKAAEDALGVKLASAADFSESSDAISTLGGTDGVFFEEIGAAVLALDPDQSVRLASTSSADSSPFLASEPEQLMYAVNSPDFIRGFREGVNVAVDKLVHVDEVLSSEEAFAAALDESRNTWGLQATKVAGSRFTGRGIKIAVLDTGFDLRHPDFAGRVIESISFIEGESVQDGHGHGTHCIGTALGSASPPVLPRYGVAPNAKIFAGKVLSNSGSGGDTGILAGINWAVRNRCHIVSMSLGAPTQIGEAHSPVYEGVAQRALAANTLIVAAAGNESARPRRINPVGRPANCPSILAVAAVDVDSRIASFSCGGVNPGSAAAVDIAGPGVAVRSTWIMPRRYRTIDGTSMATPHVAGIAALWLESQRMSATELWLRLVRSARRLNLPARDVGAGLVQAP